LNEDMNNRDVLGINGKVALVTGAGRGLGQAIALSLAHAGAKVVLVSRTESELNITADLISAFGGRSEIEIFDLSDIDSLDDLAERAWRKFSSIDILVHGAAIQMRKPAVEFSPSEMKSLINVNLLAPFLLSTSVGRRMMRQGVEGRHIFIGSLTSKIGLPNIVPYVVAKSGILGVVHGLAREWAANGITVNAVLPGYFDTELTRNLLADSVQFDRIMSRIPMAKLGDPEDVASACLFLASDMAKYITGVSLPVDGGWLAS
jgi:2-deoxy-D-gluconate 3-dehydrogenase